MSSPPSDRSRSLLGLTLRDEFKGRRLKGTAIELANENNTGATQVRAPEFLGITYPTTDVVTAIEAIGPGHGRAVVLIGERGQGKSHLLGALYHAFGRGSRPSAGAGSGGLPEARVVGEPQA